MFCKKPQKLKILYLIVKEICKWQWENMKNERKTNKAKRGMEL